MSEQPNQETTTFQTLVESATQVKDDSKSLADQHIQGATHAVTDALDDSKKGANILYDDSKNVVNARIESVTEAAIQKKSFVDATVLDATKAVDSSVKETKKHIIDLLSEE